jgi:hypothetical protein
LAHMFCNEVEVLTNWLVSRGLSGYNTTQALKVCVRRGRHGGNSMGWKRGGQSAMDPRLTTIDAC